MQLGQFDVIYFVGAVVAVGLLMGKILVFGGGRNKDEAVEDMKNKVNGQVYWTEVGDDKPEWTKVEDKPTSR